MRTKALAAVLLAAGICMWNVGVASAACVGGNSDGTKDPGEQCDDGNNVDCDAGGVGTCHNDCTLNLGCGDLHTCANQSEQCDDANANDCDSCHNNCTNNLNQCGDNHVCGTELCDDGDTTACNGCDSDCTPDTGCGDKHVCGAEACDDGNSVTTDACHNSCTVNTCGDGVICSGATCGVAPGTKLEQCDNGVNTCGSGCEGVGAAGCKLPGCGSGFACGTEVCDDGNTVDCDLTCHNDCTAIGGCGDKHVCGTEQCDDGNGSNTDACTITCANARCGDALIQTGVDQCDNGDAVCSGPALVNGASCASSAGSANCIQNGGTCKQVTTSGPVCSLSAICAGLLGVASVGVCGPAIPATSCPQSPACGGPPCNNNYSPNDCRSSCKTAFCGDGVKDAAEDCDDGLDSGAPGVRDSLDDADSCPNGPNTLALGFACNVKNQCGDGAPLLINSEARCQGCFSGNPLEECDNGGNLINLNGINQPAPKTCRVAITTICSTDADCGANGPCGNSNTKPNACRKDGHGTKVCVNSGCGDDVTDTGESCDTGSGICTGGTAAGQPCGTKAQDTACTGGGGVCTHDPNGADTNSFSCASPNCNDDVASGVGQCRAACGPTTCGDGVKDPGEGCDNGTGANIRAGTLGNGVNNNCTDACQCQVCHDNKQDTDTSGDAVCTAINSTKEACDDGNTIDTDACVGACIAAKCGDGNLQAGVEMCDGTSNCTNAPGCCLGNAANTPGCNDVTDVSTTFTAATCNLALLRQMLIDDGVGFLIKQVDAVQKKINKAAASTGKKQCSSLRSAMKKLDKLQAKIAREGLPPVQQTALDLVRNNVRSWLNCAATKTGCLL